MPAGAVPENRFLVTAAEQIRVSKSESTCHIWVALGLVILPEVHAYDAQP